MLSLIKILLISFSIYIYSIPISLANENIKIIKKYKFKNIKKTKSGKFIIPHKKDITFAGSNEATRSQKKFSISTGYTHSNGQAVSFEYFHTSKSIFGIRNSSSRFDNYQRLTSSESLGNERIYSAYYKYFIYGSFYIIGGLGYRELYKIDLYNDDDSSLINYNNEVRIKDIGFKFSMGKQWMYKMFFFGIDVIDTHSRLFRTSTSYSHNDEITKSIFRVSSDEKNHINSFQMFRPYIGLSWP